MRNSWRSKRDETFGHQATKVKNGAGEIRGSTSEGGILPIILGCYVVLGMGDSASIQFNTPSSTKSEAGVG